MLTRAASTAREAANSKEPVNKPPINLKRPQEDEEEVGSGSSDPAVVADVFPKRFKTDPDSKSTVEADGSAAAIKSVDTNCTSSALNEPSLLSSEECDFPNSEFEESSDPNVSTSTAQLIPTFADIREFPTPTIPDVNRGEWAQVRDNDKHLLADLWKSMLDQEKKTITDANYWNQHPDLLPRMRSVLLDWLKEVCQEYKLLRETFYLGVNYVDRYLSAKFGTPKNCLQLLGISALFIAAKFEEITPPRIRHFEYVSNKACSVQHIMTTEMQLLKALDWYVTPTTPVHWLHFYMQLDSTLSQQAAENGLIKSATYNVEAFDKIMRLVDLFILDPTSLSFPSSAIAASAWLFVNTYGMDQTERNNLFRRLPEVTGYVASQLEPCLLLLERYYDFDLAQHPRRTIVERKQTRRSELHLSQLHCHGFTSADASENEAIGSKTVCALFGAENAFL